MDYKSKIKMTAIIGVVIIIVIFILMIMFVSGNKGKGIKKASTNSTKTSSVNDEKVEDISLDDIQSLAIKGGYLVKIDKDCKSENIIKLEEDNKEFIDYAFDNGFAYLLYKDKSKILVYNLNLLKSNYPREIVFEDAEYNYAAGFEVLDEKIYYVTREKEIFEYDINENNGKTILSEEIKVAQNSLIIDKCQKNMFFMGKDENEVSNMYKINMETLELSAIINGFSEENDSILNQEYIVFNANKVDYLYNMEDNTIFEISSNSIGVIGNIAFYENEFVLALEEGKVVVKDYEGNILNESLYEAENISDIYMLTKDKLQITLSNNKCLIIDFIQSTILETNDVYSDILNIEGEV